MTTSNTSSTKTTSVATISAPCFGSGLDATIDIQLLLMRECDEELKDLGQEVKVNRALKKATREQIKMYRALLMQPSVDKKGKTNGKDGENKYIKIPTGTFSEIKTPKAFYFDKKNNKISEYKTNQFGSLSSAGKSGKDELIEKSKIEILVETLGNENETLNASSEALSLTIQSLTSTRKLALETVSNCISKGHEGLSTIIRNMRG